MKRIGSMALALAACAAACGDARDPAGEAAAGRLVALDSVTLQENDTAYVGSPLHLTAAGDGSLFVTDGLHNRVLRFSPAGALVRSFGGPGRGPGELADPVATALMGDSLLVVSEWGNRRASTFHVGTGAFVRSVRQEGLPFWMEARNDTVWVSGVNIPRKTVLATWAMTDDSMRYFGRVPQTYEQSPALMDFHPYATLARAGDRLFVGLSGHPMILVTRLDGTVIDSIAIPAVRRRGVPNDIVRRFERNPRGISNEEVASMASALIALHRLPGGELAAVHLDVTLNGKVITAEGFVSIVSADGGRACADTPVPLYKDGRPAVAFRGDTLIVVQQRVVSDTRAETVVQRYRVDTSACQWAPAGARQALASR